MLGAARAATESADDELSALRLIAELDLGTRTLRRDRVYPADRLHAILPLLQCAAEHSGAVVTAEILPLVPPIVGDAPMLQEALLSLLRDVLATSVPDAQFQLTLVAELGRALITINAPAHAPESVRSILGHRVILGLRGGVQSSKTNLEILLLNYRSSIAAFAK